MNLRILTLIGIAGLALSHLAAGTAMSAENATTANAPGVVVSADTVAVIVPFASDNHLRNGAAMAVLESQTNPVPLPTFFRTGFTNACAASQSIDEAICTGLFSRSFVLHPLASLGAKSHSASAFATGVHGRIHFSGGACVNCGVAIDDGLGLAIISTSHGYLPLQLSPHHLMPMISTNGEAISGQFGYDPVNHRILSPNYQILNTRNFSTGPPHFQIFSASGTPQGYDLANDQSFFFNGKTCDGGSHGMLSRDSHPDAAAIDTATNIAYVTFRSPSDCHNASTVEDIALFDLSQASFTAGTPVGSWNSPGKQIETLAELEQDLTNGITGIAIAPQLHLAIVADRMEGGGGPGIGALRLPSSSGSGTPAIVDWVQANLPDDPKGKPWRMSFMPNGVTAYTSPNSGRAMGVVMNEARTFVAVVDLESMLDAARQNGTSHTLSSSVDLVGSGIVRFVALRRHK